MAGLFRRGRAPQAEQLRSVEPPQPPPQPVAGVAKTKPAGGRPVEPNPRTKRVYLALTENEFAMWTRLAEGRPLSTWAREQVQATMLPSRSQVSVVEHQMLQKEIDQVRADLGRMGSNLNQIARGLNRGQVIEEEGLRAELAAMNENLFALMERL